MCSEKQTKKQRKAFVNLVKNLILIATSNPFCGKEVKITLPRIQNMNEDNLKPIFLEALGYVPKIILYQETEVLGEKDKRIPVVLVIVELS